MTWNYRVCKQTHHFPDEEPFKDFEPEVTYEIKEIYYDDKGEIDSYRDGTCAVYSETPRGVGEVLKMMEKALKEPVVDLDALDAKFEAIREDQAAMSIRAEPTEYVVDDETFEEFKKKLDF